MVSARTIASAAPDRSMHERRFQVARRKEPSKEAPCRKVRRLWRYFLWEMRTLFQGVELQAVFRACATSMALIQAPSVQRTERRPEDTFGRASEICIEAGHKHPAGTARNILMTRTLPPPHIRLRSSPNWRARFVVPGIAQRISTPAISPFCQDRVPLRQ